jgi:hypothetical protein
MKIIKTKTNEEVLDIVLKNKFSFSKEERESLLNSDWEEASKVIPLTGNVSSTLSFCYFLKHNKEKDIEIIKIYNKWRDTTLYWRPAGTQSPYGEVLGEITTKEESKNKDKKIEVIRTIPKGYFFEKKTQIELPALMRSVEFEVKKGDEIKVAGSVFLVKKDSVLKIEGECIVKEEDDISFYDKYKVIHEDIIEEPYAVITDIGGIYLWINNEKTAFLSSNQGDGMCMINFGKGFITSNTISNIDNKR